MKLPSENIWGRMLHALKRNKIGVLGTLAAVAVLKIGLVAYLLVVFDSHWPVDPQAAEGNGKWMPPGGEFLLGSDHLGRSIGARIFRGTATIFVVAVLSFGLCFLAGLVASAFLGRPRSWLATVFGWIQEALNCFPRLLLVITLLMFMGYHLVSAGIAIGLILSGSAMARMKEEMQKQQGAGYLVAARSLGGSPVHLFIKHRLPNLFPPLVVASLALIPDAIFLEASCGYIGISAQPPYISLGDLVGEGRSFLLDSPWIILFPGIAIMLSVLAFHLMGKAFERALRESREWLPKQYAVGKASGE